MFKSHRNNPGVSILLLCFLILISTQFYGALSDLKTPSDITTVHGNFPSDELESFLINNIFDIHQSLLKDRLDLVKRVWLIDEAIISDTGADLRLHTFR